MTALNTPVDENDMCQICNSDKLPAIHKKKLRGRAKVKWTGCDICERWFHHSCLEESMSSTIPYVGSFTCNECK